MKILLLFLLTHVSWKGLPLRETPQGRDWEATSVEIGKVSRKVEGNGIRDPHIAPQGWRDSCPRNTYRGKRGEEEILILRNPVPHPFTPQHDSF
jgi:hypothetical protein